jgi:hypothetical protein
VIIYDQRSPRGRCEAVPSRPLDLPHGFAVLGMSWKDADATGQTRRWMFPERERPALPTMTCALDECRKTFAPSMATQVFCQIKCGVRQDTIKRRAYFRERARLKRAEARA